MPSNFFLRERRRDRGTCRCTGMHTTVCVKIRRQLLRAVESIVSLYLSVGSRLAAQQVPFPTESSHWYWRKFLIVYFHSQEWNYRELCHLFGDQVLLCKSTKSTTQRLLLPSPPQSWTTTSKSSSQPAETSFLLIVFVTFCVQHENKDFFFVPDNKHKNVS